MKFYASEYPMQMKIEGNLENSENSIGKPNAFSKSTCTREAWEKSIEWQLTAQILDENREWKA